MKRKIKLTESQLHQVIKEATKKVFNEGFANGDSGNERWEEMTEELSPTDIINAIYNYLNDRELQDFMDYLETEYYDN